MPQILAFGDSITDGFYDNEGGWASRMQRFFMAANVEGGAIKDKIDWFYNLGINGDTAKDVLRRIEVESEARKINRPDKASIVIFAIGINDSACEGGSSDARFTPEEFAANLGKLAGIIKQHTDKIIFVGLTPVVEQYTQPIYKTSWYDNYRIGLFDEAVRKVAREKNAIFIDIFRTMQEQTDWKNYFIDGLHPNTTGHKWMYERIKPEILKILNT
ncbi:MAG: GDSL-type esterase/lipase family protein [Candidatus Saccharimonadales bacterium]